MSDKIWVIERRTGNKIEEKVYFEGALRFLYGSLVGKGIAALLARLPFVSSLFGWWQKQRITQKKIAPFVEKYGVDLSEFQQGYPSFNDFFIRKLREGARPIGEGAIIPADGRYLFYQNIEKCDGFVVKGKKFSLTKLIGDQALANKYVQGSMMIARLAPCDYHRFHFPITCLPGKANLLNGLLHSVNPIAVKQNVDLLCENKRVLTPLYSDHYGTLLYIEIGATNVGSIHQTYTPQILHKKGEEKGYFSFGGSSLILLFEKGRVQFAEDLLINSNQQIETLCLFGQSIEK